MLLSVSGSCSQFICISQRGHETEVHSQSEGMQLTEVQETRIQVVNFGHGLCNSTHHALSVLLHRLRSRAQVLPVGEVGLGLWVDHQHPEEHMRESNRLNIYFLNKQVF
uniref:Uncharacterized protein n=1 Tax=Cyclopterus lumpus TaxID=8103 RepID=A0A8C2XBT6_CYCLU